mmetsp:Transcript_25999/g.41258  ORF Transcript_25999/g.41258 Transcript_25999/m.41258 type:complete len:646 (+) Transcript_25999:70-2007(+)
MRKSLSQGAASTHGVPGCLPDADHARFFPSQVLGRRNSNASTHSRVLELAQSKFGRRTSDMQDREEQDEYAFQKSCQAAQQLAERRKAGTSSTTSMEFVSDTIVKEVDAPPADVKDLIQAMDAKLDKLLASWSKHFEALHAIEKSIVTCAAHASHHPQQQSAPQDTPAPLPPSNGARTLQAVPSPAWSIQEMRSETTISGLSVPREALTSNLTPESSFGAESADFLGVVSGSRGGSRVGSKKTSESPPGSRLPSRIRESGTREERRPTTTSMMSDASIVHAVRQHQQQTQILANIYYSMEEPESSKYGFIYVTLVNIFLIGSSCLTLTKLADMWSNDSLVAFCLEIVIDGLFTIEVLVRFAACPNRVVFFYEYYNYVDMAAGLPPLLLRIVNFSLNRDTNENTTDNILLGVVPVLRYLKLLRRFEKFHLLFKAFKLTFDALPVLLFTMTILILGFAALFFVVEPRDNIPTLGLSLYAVTMTLTTVGYGDVYPVTAPGQATMGLLSICSTLYLAIPVGIVGSAFSCVWNDRDRVLLFKRIRKRLREMGLAAIDIPSLFKHFDADRDGLLSISEFCHMVSQLKVNISLRRITQLFRLIDTDGSGGIDDEEFISTLFPEAHALIYSRNDHSDETTCIPQQNGDTKIVP